MAGKKCSDWLFLTIIIQDVIKPSSSSNCLIQCPEPVVNILIPDALCATAGPGSNISIYSTRCFPAQISNSFHKWNEKTSRLWTLGSLIFTPKWSRKAQSQVRLNICTYFIYGVGSRTQRVQYVLAEFRLWKMNTSVSITDSREGIRERDLIWTLRGHIGVHGPHRKPYNHCKNMQFVYTNTIQHTITQKRNNLWVFFGFIRAVLSRKLFRKSITAYKVNTSLK